MIQLNMHEAKAHLSRYLTKLKAGESIILCKRNHPVAQITRLSEVATGCRPIGLAKQTFSVQAALFKPLPEELLETSKGRKR